MRANKTGMAPAFQKLEALESKVDQLEAKHKMKVELDRAVEQLGDKTGPEYQECKGYNWRRSELYFTSSTITVEEAAIKTYHSLVISQMHKNEEHNPPELNAQVQARLAKAQEHLLKAIASLKDASDEWNEAYKGWI